MKVDPKATMTAAAVTKAEPFKKLLAEAKAELGAQRTPATTVPAPARPALTASPKLALARASTVAHAHAPVVQTLQHARTQANHEAQRLGTVRAQHAQTAEGLERTRTQHGEATVEKREARIIDFIVRELTQDERPPRPTEPATVHHLQPMLGAAVAAPPKPEVPAETKAAQAVALIEKIEVFVKSQRPGLALTLNNSLGAHVEIERIGPKEIALKLVGHRGPPTAEAVSRIRDELRARGLKVGALSVA